MMNGSLLALVSAVTLLFEKPLVPQLVVLP